MGSHHTLLNYLTAACLAFGLSIAPLHAADIEAHHHGRTDSPIKLKLNNGKKWQTDAVLRTGMDRIRIAMKPSVHAIHAGKLANADYDRLARQIDKEVNFIVANCKLDPQADVQLHLVIADIADGAAAMRDNVSYVERQKGASKVLDALDRYASYFNHPDWEPIYH